MMTVQAIVARFEYEYKFKYDSVKQKYVTKKSSMAPIWKYMSHGYGNKHFFFQILEEFQPYEHWLNKKKFIP
jgi:hypothetical protein